MKVEALQKGNYVSEIELTYTPPKNLQTAPQILHSGDAYDIFIKRWDLKKLEFIEQFKILLLNKANRILGICTLSTGGSASTVIDIRLLFALALKANANAIIVAHNHPSGEVHPSRNDIAVTIKINEAAKLLDIVLLDHLIVNKHTFYSFKSEGTI